MDLVREAIGRDPRFSFVKCAEGARADFAVHRRNRPDRAIGVQLKTCHRFQRVRNTEFAAFSDTDGYDGLLVLLISCVTSPPRAWLLPGADIGTRSRIFISVAPKQKYYDWSQHELSLDNLPAKIHTASREMEPRPVDQLCRPSYYKRVVEYDALVELRKRLLLDFVEPDVEHLPYDYIVDGRRWQMKTATLCSTDDYHVRLSKYACRKDGKNVRRQYEETDFEWLLVHLPDPTRAYLIPMRELLAHGAAGRSDVKHGGLHLYPHRVPRSGPSWTHSWIIDLTSHTTAMSDYRRLMDIE